jgi:hypothetical protein
MHEVKYKPAYFPATSSVEGVGIMPMGSLLGYRRKVLSVSTITRIWEKPQNIFCCSQGTGENPNYLLLLLE